MKIMKLLRTLFKREEPQRPRLKDLMATQFEIDTQPIPDQEERTLKKYLKTQFKEDLVSFEKPMFHLNIQRLK